MNQFPSNAKFCFPWRPYQARVLEELETHLEDDHLNIVAAPGSGKTILGLEVMLRINRPTLILAPSIAIRNQWIVRFKENFLQTTENLDWISQDIRNPKFLTVSTYQGLHAAFTDQKELEEEAELENEEEEFEEESPKKCRNSFASAELILEKLEAQGLQTIIIDEAHHLRNEWWKSLIHLKNGIKSPHVVALTATPPYDVSPQEWKNYQNLCGPIDAEISVPELVLEKNLCPHQDYVFLNSLSREENQVVKAFRTQVDYFLKNLSQHTQFIQLLKQHPCLLDYEKNIEKILDNPEYFSSIVIFLHAAGHGVDKKFVKIIGGSKWRVPGFDRQWAEILLENFLYHDSQVDESHQDFLAELKRELKKIGAIERRKVLLNHNKETKKLLRESLNKLNSILEIVQLEHQNLGNHLRMVVLSDFIRAEYFPKAVASASPLNRLGVVPIFEKIRRDYPQATKLGILSGSLVVIPQSAESCLKMTAQKMNIAESHLKISKLAHDEKFIKLEIKGENNQKIVQLITEVFSQGEMQILIGTQALLGEGWDAPSVNTLILASFVGSFMLSNQMRGRAIRIDSKQPDKVANIWHLASVEKRTSEVGNDLKTLARRFKAFVGISLVENTIENGIRRMKIPTAPYSERKINQSNQKTLELAMNRDLVRNKWQKALAAGKFKNIIPELQSEKAALPRNFYFMNTIVALVWRSLLLGAYFVANININVRGVRDFKTLLTVLGFVFLVVLVVSLPGLIKALWLFLKNGPIASHMKQMAEVLLQTLCQFDLIKTDLQKVKVITEPNEVGQVFCGMEGGTSYEKSIFLDALEEMINPIQNPRYLLIRQSRFLFFNRQDYHSVPQLIAAKKEYAEFFAKLWKKKLGKNQLIYTRNFEGRFLLLKARRHALSARFQKRSDRLERWK
ncbi:MAG: DEAD/DEAH box helicase family protein [Deltaproteobacteria bacterium]|nr:DEAD/DEAH box helicase family protein [Deltaproteobacteria bacterium]